MPFNRRVRSVIKGMAEKKFFNYFLNANPGAFATAPVIAPMGNPTIGTSDSNRIGDQITMLTARIRYSLELADTTNAVRVIILAFKDVNFAAFTMSDLMNTIGSSTEEQEVMSYYNRDQLTRFQILYDKIHFLDEFHPYLQQDLVIKLKDMKQQFVGGSQDCSNQIFIVAYSDSAAATHPQLQVSARFTFIDF